MAVLKSTLLYTGTTHELCVCFCCQGTGPEVPKYLSFDGPVRNRRLGKRDTLLLIRDIWREKAASDAEVREFWRG